jgi:hypothetical protein
VVFGSSFFCIGLDETVQGTAGSAQLIDLFFHFRVLFQGRGVVGLQTSIDYERSFTSPMLAMGKRSHAVYVCGRV